MATKKKTAETVKEPEIREEVSPETEEKLLAEELNRLRREREELLMENESLKAEAEEFRVNDIDMVGEHDNAYWEEKIRYTIPFDGDEEDVSIKVNGDRVLAKRGETVEIKRNSLQYLRTRKRRKERPGS